MTETAELKEPKKLKSKRAIFMARTRNIYRHQEERAKHPLDYDLADLRAMVTYAVANLGCRYCARELTVKTFSLDHFVPIARDGSFSEDNLAVCCITCNLAKGNMNAIEYNALMETLDTFPEEVRNEVIGRLKFGNLAKRRSA